MKIFKKCIISALFIFLSFYFFLPPLNLRSSSFWLYFLFVAAVELFIFIDFKSVNSNYDTAETITLKEKKTRKRNSKKSYTYENNFKLIKKAPWVKTYFICLCATAGLIAVISFLGSPLLNAEKYASLISVSEGVFEEDVAEISMSQIPVVDKSTAIRLGSRKLGEISDLVSQFIICENYTQINYQQYPFRVTPLGYADVFKWATNQANGIPGYITVNMATQETNLVMLDEGIKYSETEYFFRNLNRYLRFKYPTKVFAETTFELDDNGTPFWVASTVSYKIFCWGGADITGAVMVNAITGETQYCSLSEIPKWVDQAFDSEMIISHLDYYGMYSSGFFNSIVGQRGVLNTTDGYNYVAINDDVYLYTGMTSVVADESNVGFVLVNLRTKETKFYSIPGAEEYSAMISAEGQVQHLGYQSTFPILLNYANRPTYFVSLKDEAGLAKMYAFIDVERYQIVGTGTTPAAAMQAHTEKLRAESLGDINASVLSGVIKDIKSVVINGNTYYYIRLESHDMTFIADISLSSNLPFACPGDQVKIKYSDFSEPYDVISFEIQ